MLDRIRHQLQDPNRRVTGVISKNHIILDVCEEDIHYWSPQLNFRVEEDEENSDHSWVAGLIGPRPAVWTLFMFVYFSIGVAGFFASVYGVSEYMVGRSSIWIWAFPLALLLMLTAYAVSRYGEQLAADQTETLKQFVRDAIYTA